MSKIISDIVSDSLEKKGLISPQDMYDRVIDLGFTCTKNENGKVSTEYYVLRSDYQISVDSFINYEFQDRLLLKGYITKCAYKPSIRVKCTQLKDHGISIRLYIDNFYMISKSGKISRNLVMEDISVDKVTIAMGYFSQFIPPQTLDEFYDISQNSGNGITVLDSNFNFCTVEGSMPDSTTVIDLVMGSSSVSPVDVVYSETDYSYIKEYSKGTGYKLTDLFNEMITMRFINMTSLNLKDAKGEDSIKYKTFLNEVFNAKKAGKSLRENPNYEAFMKEHGVKVYPSFSVHYLDLYPKLKFVDNTVTEQEYNLPVIKGSTVINTVRIINRVYNLNLKAFPLPDGNIFVCAKNEFAPEEIKELTGEVAKIETYKDDVFTKIYENKLPAIYSISKSVAGISIKCPFFSFIKPFEKVIFKTDYGNLDFTLALLNKSNETTMFVVQQDIDFATVDDINEVTLVGATQEEE